MILGVTTLHHNPEQSISVFKVMTKRVLTLLLILLSLSVSTLSYAGSLSVTKVLTNAPAGMDSAIFKFSIDCDGSVTSLSVGVNGTSQITSIPNNTICKVTELVNERPVLPEGYVYDTESYSPAQSVIILSGDNKVTVTSPILNIDLSVIKTASVAGAGIGEVFFYTLTVRNLGTIAAEGVFVEDQLPMAVTYLSDNAPSTGTTYSNGVWDIGDLAIGASIALNITVRVN